MPDQMHLILFFILILSGCKQRIQSPQPAFYHWQTRFEPNATAKSLLHDLDVPTIWVKYFDLDWDSQQQSVTPRATIIWADTPSLFTTIVPTIFITTRSLDNTSIHDLPYLAQKVARKINALHPAGYAMPEVQLDCDWTPSNQSAYFTFIQALKKEMPTVTTWSSTIRLHQVHHFKETGVPPVDRGILMFYNMGQLRAWEETNAILNVDAAIPYMSENISKYPIDLDLALPLYQWGAVFRDNQLIYLINNLQASTLHASTHYAKIAYNRFEVTEATFLDGYFLYEGDRIRIDAPTYPELQIAAEKAANWFPKRPKYISFYHLDSIHAANWTYEEIRSILLHFD